MKNKIKILIRQETKTDYSSVYSVVKKSFEAAEHTDGNEHILVEKLRKSDAFIPELSLVAEYNGKIIGYILFTKIIIGKHTLLSLAPLAVLPEFQNAGVGSELIKKGHEIAKKIGFIGVILLGYPTYYSRFGYLPSTKWDIKAPFDLPEEYFMAIELEKDSLKAVKGIVQYPKEFGI